jgi:hypothetical protein
MKTDSGDAAKTPRRKRHDPAQSKPKFSELTALWFGDAPESKWNATKAKFGYYLHPQLVSLISGLSIRKTLSPMEVSKEWVSRYLDQNAVYQRPSGLSEGLFAALLAGDDAFFEHLALTLRSLASGVEWSNIQYVTVTDAYFNFLEKRAVKAWENTREASDKERASGKGKIAASPTLHALVLRLSGVSGKGKIAASPTGLIKANISARAKARNYEGLGFPEPHQVLDEILKNPIFLQHRGYWEKGDSKAHLHTIRRHLRKANLRYSDARKSKPAKPTKGRAKVQS